VRRGFCIGETNKYLVVRVERHAAQGCSSDQHEGIEGQQVKDAGQDNLLIGRAIAIGIQGDCSVCAIIKNHNRGLPPPR
jgi:hypothetical protein